MRLLAISDIHIANTANHEAMLALPDSPEDWIILAGDVAERRDMVDLVFKTFSEKFAKVIWVPGNHELWTVERDGPPSPRGEARYLELADIARRHNVHTPEDGFLTWPGDGGKRIIAPLFLLYDYSFRPDDVPFEDVRAWAEEEHAVCSDEYLLRYEPYASRQAWCEALCDKAERELSNLPQDTRTILINHWPLREDLVFIPRVPRFSPWCGTKRTHDWHRRFNAEVVVSGHLHTRRTDYLDGTRFEEVSLGYARQWDQSFGMEGYIREILPD